MSDFGLHHPVNLFFLSLFFGVDSSSNIFFKKKGIWENNGGKKKKRKGRDRALAS
jgi:hypothetical protein